MPNGNGAIDFSAVGGKPVSGGAAPALDFSSIGGQQVSPSPAAAQQAAPQGTPGFLGYLKGVGQGIAQTVGSAGQGGGPSYLSGGGINQPQVYTPPTPAFEPQSEAEKGGYYSEKVAEIAAPVVGGIAKAAKLAGAAEEAGEIFQSLASEIGGNSVDTSAAQDIALKAKEWAGRGGQLPKVIRNFISRAADENLGAVTYNEARDFYSNATSRLSAEQAQKLTPVASRYMAQFASALDSSIEDTAAAAGRADDYRNAMSQYASGKGFESGVEALTDWAKQQALKWAVPGTIYAIRKEILALREAVHVVNNPFAELRANRMAKQYSARRKHVTRT